MGRMTAHNRIKMTLLAVALAACSGVAQASDEWDSPGTKAATIEVPDMH
jgi:hypothetical protein